MCACVTFKETNLVPRHFETQIRPSDFRTLTLEKSPHIFNICETKQALTDQRTTTEAGDGGAPHKTNLYLTFSRLITKSFTLGSPLLFLGEQVVFIITMQDDFSSVCLIIDSCKQVYKCEAP